MKKEIHQKEPKAKSEASLTLTQTNFGFYQPENHAKMIWQGNQSLVVESLKVEGIAGKDFYLTSNNMVFGVMKVNSVTQIGLKEFEELKEKHRVTDIEFSERFKGKKILFAYDVTLKKKFDFPLRAIAKQEDSFITNIQLLSEQVEPEITTSLKDVVLLESCVSIPKTFLDKPRPDKLDFLVEKRILSLSDLIQTKFKPFFQKEKKLTLKDKDEETGHFLPIYDLVLVKKTFLELNKPRQVKPMELFEMEIVSEKFYDMDKLLSEMFGG